jgi:hypothetical protein
MELPMSNLMWKSDTELVEFLRSGTKLRASKARKIENLQAKINEIQGQINNSLTETTWANKYLMHDLTGTRFENDLEGWHAQRDLNKPANSAE